MTDQAVLSNFVLMQDAEGRNVPVLVDREALNGYEPTAEEIRTAYKKNGVDVFVPWDQDGDS